MSLTAEDEAARARRWPATLAWSLWALAIPGVGVMAWLSHLLRQAGRPDLAPLGPSDTTAYVVGMLSAVTVGALLASRRPAHPVGWLLLAMGLSVLGLGVSYGYANHGLVARPGALPGAIWAAAYNNDVSFVPLATCLGFVLLLTPTGSPPSPRWRRWARVVASAPALALVAAALLPFEEPYQRFANPLEVPALAGPLGVVGTVAQLVIVASIPVAAASLVVRYRRARGVERQQLRWVALAAGLVVVTLLALVAAIPIGNDVLLGWLTAVDVALLPLATGAAIMRYRLYDIDRIVSRTLAYGLLTLLLGLCYAAVVLALGQLLPRDSSLAVAAGTLAVAALFQPARRRVQETVDRRFDRRRYDAARTIQAFSARLRDEVDLDTLTGELVAVVERTMQPTSASLWLRPSPATSGGPAATR
jgi:hypothetical protein